MDKISGIYKITNIITSDFYIGSSTNIMKRWAYHRSPSVWIKHQPNFRLYKDMQGYGLDNFTFEVLEETSSLREREQYWIDQLKPSYNSSWAYGLDIEKSKERNKEWHKNHREEHLKKMKAYRQAHRDELLVKQRAYGSKLCLYKGETLTLQALIVRLRRRGIPHPTLEAKKYLI